MAEAADGSELFDAVFTGDNLVSKPRIDAIVFLSLLAGRTRGSSSAPPAWRASSSAIRSCSRTSGRPSTS